MQNASENEEGHKGWCGVGACIATLQSGGFCFLFFPFFLKKKI